MKDIIVAKFTFQEITWNQRRATSFSPHRSPVIALVILGSITMNSASILSFLLEPPEQDKGNHFMLPLPLFFSLLAPLYRRRVAW